jgi:hypothetical protein
LPTTSSAGFTMTSANFEQNISFGTHRASSQVVKSSDAATFDNAVLSKNTVINIIAIFFAIVSTVAVSGIVIHHCIRRRAKQQFTMEI